MAKQIIKETIVTDDLTGDQADDIESVSFSLDGTHYEIDLHGENRAALHDGLAEFIQAARVVKVKRGRTSKSAARNRDRSSDMRVWCKANFADVRDRGRIPAAAVEAYHAAHAAHAA